MYSLIHTPVLPLEIQTVFRLTPEIYRWALECGALCASYADSEDPIYRLRLHNISDAILFSVMLAMGWPIRPVGAISEQAEDIADDLWYAWENYRDEVELICECSYSFASSEGDHLEGCNNSMYGKVFEAIEARNDLSAKRKHVLRRHILALTSLIRHVTQTQLGAAPVQYVVDDVFSVFSECSIEIFGCASIAEAPRVQVDSFAIKCGEDGPDAGRSSPTPCMRRHPSHAPQAAAVVTQIPALIRAGSPSY